MTLKSVCSRRRLRSIGLSDSPILGLQSSLVWKKAIQYAGRWSEEIEGLGAGMRRKQGLGLGLGAGCWFLKAGFFVHYGRAVLYN